MIFSKGPGKTILLKKSTCRRAAFILSFMLPVAVMLCIFIIRGIYPFGDRSFLFSDMYHQYMPFFSEFLRKIRAGEGLGFSYQVGIGSNFLALYVYYLASPLNWLAFLVPEAHLMEFMSYLVVVRVGLCGLTCFWYLQKHFQTKDGAVLFFSCFYAMSGFIAAYNWNIMWLDCVVLLPLIVLGLERLVKEGRCGLYCAALSLCILTNFYISIMVCIYLALYFVTLLVTEKRSLRIIADFALYSLLAGGMAAALLVPEVCAVLATDFGDISFPKTLESYFSVLDMLARHCMCVVTERGLEHWPNVYCGVAVFLLLPLYVLNRKIPIKKRFCNMALAGFLLLSFATNMLDFTWHGLNYPDSLPARQSFAYILLLLTMCCEAYRNLGEESERQILYGYLGAAAFLLFCEKFVDSEDFETGIKALTLVFVTIYAVLLYLYRTRGAAARWAVGFAALIAVTAESSINLYNTSIGTTSRPAYLDELADYQALHEYAEEQEQGFYRMEKFTRKTKNDGTLAGYPTASLFSSTLNSSVMDLYARWGMRHSKVYYGFDGATAFTSALLNVRWMFGENAPKESGFGQGGSGQSASEQSDFGQSSSGQNASRQGGSGQNGSGQSVSMEMMGENAPTATEILPADTGLGDGLENGGHKYENMLYTWHGTSGAIDLYACEITLPFGYVAPFAYDLPEKGNGIRLQNQMVRGLGVQGSLFEGARTEEAGDDVRITARRSGIYYAVITSGDTKKVDIIGGGLEEMNYSDIKNGSIVYLGYLHEGDTVTLTNGDEDDETPKVFAEGYVMNEEALQRACEILSQNCLADVTYDSTHVSGRLDLEEPGRLILSIPYEKGWIVEVNGEKAEPALFGGSLIALDLEAGAYEINMRYIPEGRNAGVIISVVSVLVTAGIFAGRKYKGKFR